MIRSFPHSGLEKFFRTGAQAGINPDHARKLEGQIAILNRATTPLDMNLPGWRAHPLQGDLADHWAVMVNGNWRLTFRFEGQDAILVDYRDYH